MKRINNNNKMACLSLHGWLRRFAINLSESAASSQQPETRKAEQGGHTPAPMLPLQAAIEGAVF